MTEPTQQTQGFTPDDLVQAVLLIDEGVNQGAYRGWEQIQKAAAIRAKILAFAQSWQASIEATAAAEVANTAVEAAEAPVDGEAQA